ncbi:hypothetical protein [Acanthopleuribacter pedis]|uniref:Nucleotidyltransferase n=1 Tax=Acanthopleuribacter pedis TaxID=442870 RepID=A0A8J7QI19_9BACT|nr:hypothetical protein [Acanthopleuribacter pedis]MBO1322815.1 hypothetical protein [Acanthopleuribacter pedis]
MKSPLANFLEILKVLTKHEVDFIVVGGVCGVFHGAPITTFDLDILRATDEANAPKLLGALDELEGRSRLHQKVVKPNHGHLKARGHLLLNTRFGHLDILATIGKGHDYDDLIQQAKTGSLQSISFRLLDLETLIKTKEEVGRPKDLAVLPVLRATLREKG